MLDSGIKMKKNILIIGDAILLFFSLWLTLITRYGSANSWKDHLLPFAIVYIISLIIFYINGLYELDFGKNKSILLNKILISLAFVTLFAAAFFYFGSQRILTIKPQRVLLINIVFIFGLIMLWRIFIHRFITSTKLAANLLIIYHDTLSQEIIQKVIEKPQLGFSLKVVLANQELGQKLPPNIFIFKDHRELPKICNNYNIDTILFPENIKQDKDFLKNLFSCLPLNVSFYELSSFYEKMTGKVPVDYINHTWFLENLREGPKKVYESIKRIFDIIFSVFSMITALPFIPFIILAIVIDDPGPFLFKQTRIGKNGKKFLAMKFRSMKMDSEKTGPQWAQKNDSRVTRVGKIFRKTRIDEIPQLINIFRGEMSFIGPRPERPEFVEELKKQIPYYEERLLIKPGLTGWAQVMGPSYGGSVTETLEKIQYDLFYIKNRSFGLDVSIILKTIKTVLTGAGQ